MAYPIRKQIKLSNLTDEEQQKLKDLVEIYTSMMPVATDNIMDEDIHIPITLGQKTNNLFHNVIKIFKIGMRLLIVHLKFRSISVQ